MSRGEVFASLKRHRSHLLVAVVVLVLVVVPLAGVGWKLYQRAQSRPSQEHAVVPEAYWVLGPFGANLHQTSGFELNPDPSRPFKGADGAVLRWEEVRVIPGVECLDFRKAFKKDNSSGYALTFITSPADQPGQLLLGSDDTIKVWVNGEVVHEYARFRLGRPDEDQVAVRWRQGRNTLLIKVGNLTGDHLFFARCVGAPGLVATTKPANY